MSRCDYIIAVLDIKYSTKQTNHYLCNITMVEDMFYLLNQLVKNVLRRRICQFTATRADLHKKVTHKIEWENRAN